MKKYMGWMVLVLVTIVTLALGWSQEPYHPWEEVPGIYILLGFVGCLVIIVIAKALGKLLVSRPEDYYDS